MDNNARQGKHGEVSARTQSPSLVVFGKIFGGECELSKGAFSPIREPRPILPILRPCRARVGNSLQVMHPAKKLLTSASQQPWHPIPTMRSRLVRWAMAELSPINNWYTPPRPSQPREIAGVAKVEAEAGKKLFLLWLTAGEVVVEARRSAERVVRSIIKDRSSKPSAQIAAQRVTVWTNADAQGNGRAVKTRRREKYSASAWQSRGDQSPAGGDHNTS